MLAADTPLGPYRIVAPIGAGGMGEVYRATDTRLGREVAIKVLTASLSHEPDALRRFETEARAAGMLNHPNVLAIYDIGSDGGRHYIVSELLEGESLRSRLRQGPLPARKAVEYAVQFARGLAAAHDKGIVHRDLKPENVFITRDGQVKILDFGLVKLLGTHRIPGVREPEENAPTLPTTPTEPGRVLGTVGYMAPEQVRGQTGDQRADIFSFGAILYEMLSGKQAFHGDSSIETLNSILRDEPEDLYELNVRVPAPLERVIRHCLEKSPEERFQSARDLAFDLSAMSGLTTASTTYGLRLGRFRWRRMWKPLLALLAFALAIGGGYLIGQRNGRRPPPAFRRLTFRSGTILNARFSPDGQTVFYGAKWAGTPVSIFAVRPESPESKDLGFGTSDILAVSSTGQLAISLRRHPIGFLRDSGTLAQAPISGGAPRELLEEVEAADWTPDGSALAIVRTLEGKCRLEYPIGKVLYSTLGSISNPRFNAAGDRIAFLDHPFPNDDRGDVAVVDLKGKVTKLTNWTQPVSGVAWRRGEIWYSAEINGMPRSLRAVTLSGKERQISTSAGAIWLHDISRDGRVLVTQDDIRGGIFLQAAGEAKPRDLSWLDYSVVRDLSPDGKTIIFSESGDAGGSLFGVYVRSTDGASPAIRLGDGTSEALSPDGKWVLSIPRNRKPAQIAMLPVGAGQPRLITHDAIDHHAARWFPDGQHVLFQGSAAGQAPRVWMQALDGTPPRAVSPENAVATLVTPDGTRLLGRGSDRKYAFYPVAGGAPIPVPALRGGDVPVRFADDGTLFVGSFGRIPAMLYRVNLVTGERVIWREVMPTDPAGLINVGPVLVTPDGKDLVYSYTRLLSNLYLAEKVE